MKVETLLLSGGGVHGIMYIGALKYIEELVESSKLEVEYKEVAGVSVGALLAFLVVVGYTYLELERELLNKDLSSLVNVRIGNLYNYGLDTGVNLITWIESLLLRKLNKTKSLTFEELYRLIPIKLSMYASNVSRYELTEFSYKTTPKLEVLKALRMSLSIPFLFTKVVYQGDIFVDGMIIDVFPIHLFEDKIEEGTFLGLKINATNCDTDERRVQKTFEDYIYMIMSCYIFFTSSSILLRSYRGSMVVLMSPYRNHLDFNLTNDQKRVYIDNAYKYMKEGLVDVFSLRAK